MKALTLLALLVTATVAGKAQPAELMAGHRYAFYQHSIYKPFTEKSRFGLMHIASAVMRYEQKSGESQLPHELMNQAYAGYKVCSHFSLLAGGFFNTAVGFRPSVGMQFRFGGRNWFAVLQPRTDIMKKASYELFGLAEWKQRLTRRIYLYTRFQFMSNMGLAGHNRSYQQLRLGLGRGKMQAGFAFQADAYGPQQSRYFNSGFFVKKDLF